MHYDKEIISEELNNLVAYTKKNAFQLIIGADSNAHSNMWGPSPKNKCKRGEDLEQWILQHGIMIHNTGETPTFANKRCNSCIDVTLSLDLRSSIKDWEVSQDYNGSDHNTITSNLELVVPKPDPVWNWKKAEWEKFKEILSKSKIRIPTVMNERRVEYILKRRYKKIDQAMVKPIPKITPSGKESGDKWYGERQHNMRKKGDKIKTEVCPKAN